MEFKGELHKVKLINFSVDYSEIENLIPSGLKALQENGKAIISMVDVQLKKMRPTIFPLATFGYRHVAFRLLLDDTKYSNENQPKGIYFLKGFSEKIALNCIGNLIGNYRLTLAKIQEHYDAFSLKRKNNFVEYALDPYEKVEAPAELFNKIKRIDRAYAPEGGDIMVTKIAREAWPIEPIKCYHFATNFFKTAKFLGAFQVKNVIHYTWKDPLKIN